jgi:hypothetical protein
VLVVCPQSVDGRDEEEEEKEEEDWRFESPELRIWCEPVAGGRQRVGAERGVKS